MHMWKVNKKWKETTTLRIGVVKIWLRILIEGFDIKFYYFILHHILIIIDNLEWSSIEFLNVLRYIQAIIP